MPLPKPNTYTVEDIYLLPDGQRAELIDGQIDLQYGSTKSIASETCNGIICNHQKLH